MRSRAKLNMPSFLFVAPFSIDSIFITCELNLDMRFVLILNYKHVRTAGLRVRRCGEGEEMEREAGGVVRGRRGKELQEVW